MGPRFASTSGAHSKLKNRSKTQRNWVLNEARQLLCLGFRLTCYETGTNVAVVHRRPAIPSLCAPMPLPSSRSNFGPCLMMFLIVTGAVLGCTTSKAQTQVSHQHADQNTREVCPRPPAGSVVPEPEDLRSANGVLKADFTYANSLDDHGQMLYCYLYKDGSQAPNLLVHPGDWLTLRLKNDLHMPSGSAHHDHTMTRAASSSCGHGNMDAWSTNLHFHGLTVPAVCHQDDVLNTSIAPGGPPFEYRFQIPADEPPGVYWYHPHIHGFTTTQVEGGASGALIVEGVEQENTLLAGMPERVLIVRDQPLVNPDAAPSNGGAPVLRDPEGDILNTGTGGGKPSRDLSLNFVPVAYPDYPPALIAMKPGEHQFWRLLNASAITYLDLQIVAGGAAQQMGVVSLDGVLIDEGGMLHNHVVWLNHVLVPPGGRVEFLYYGPPEGGQASLITLPVDTGPAGENDPLRPLATIITRPDAPEPRSALPSSTSPVGPHISTWLGNAKPVRQRKLYFSERSSDPQNPNSPTVFMLTVDGQPTVPYDPHSTVPNITVQAGDVEDWIIENRSRELHAFHIHQLHFLLIERNGVPLCAGKKEAQHCFGEPLVLDTVNVDYWDGITPTYPSVKLRMDFRAPNMIGTFVYHCHLLEHEDGGMMGTIRVAP
jgi:FtsP/CotA-like multicopper oxidase with cupredoxin domain